MPSKKMIVATFVLLSAAVAIFAYTQPSKTTYKGSGGLAANPFSLLESEKSSDLTKKDTDSDGLKDWEESLWGTDPDNPDTDGDGTNDGEEISLNRNPTVAGPDDKIDNTLLQNLEEDSNYSDFSKTDAVSRIFFRKYLILQQSEGNIDEETRNTLVDEAIEDIFKETNSPQIYKESDLNIISNSDGALRSYGNKIVSIVDVYVKQNPENELTVFEEALETKNEKTLESLNVSSEMYGKISKDFVKMAVPKELVSTHLDFIEVYLKLSRSAGNMSSMFSDPVLGIVGFKEHVQTLNTQISLSQSLKEYFKQKGIIFTKTESGYVWSK